MSGLASCDRAPRPRISVARTPRVAVAFHTHASIHVGSRHSRDGTGGLRRLVWDVEGRADAAPHHRREPGRFGHIVAARLAATTGVALRHATGPAGAARAL